jgi:hypothetical protein
MAGRSSPASPGPLTIPHDATVMEASDPPELWPGRRARDLRPRPALTVGPARPHGERPIIAP